jgi:hypothetical protein
LSIWDGFRARNIVEPGDSNKMKNEMRTQQAVIGGDRGQPCGVGGERIAGNEVMPSEAHMPRMNEGE